MKQNSLFNTSCLDPEYMKRTYKNAVLSELLRTNELKTEILTERDISHLPGIVQKYMYYTGVVGREKVVNFRAVFIGGIRGRSTEAFMKLRSVQYNFMDHPSRLFYIVASKMGIPVKGVHIYLNETAIMKIKILGLFTVVDAKGKEMNQGETVTVLNDMCVMAPASLTDSRISWEIIDELSVRARFTNGSISVSANLFFEADGKLVNFISYDRYETTDGKTYHNYPWLTPISEYKTIRGFRLPSKAELIYRHPDEELCYGKFELEDIEYNCRVMK
jgi:hypothetical protein